jgi:uncharacterized protein (TIGR00730 family)
VATEVGLFDVELLRGERTEAVDEHRLAEIATEFRTGFEAFRDLGPCVTFFGSARFGVGHRYYELTRRAAAAFGAAGFAVMTGGGPGLMEAANRGAHEVGAPSLGCTIELPNGQAGNAYVDRTVDFRHFFARKVMLVRYSQAFLLMPGGFGTLDEVFETATLIQTGKMPGFPLVLMGTDFWRPITRFVTQSLVREGTIDDSDRHYFYATDDPAEAVTFVESRLNGRPAPVWTRPSRRPEAPRWPPTRPGR